MSDLLVIEGVISAEAEEAVRVASLSRTAPGLSLPLAGAVLLHLAILGLALAAPRLGGERELPPAVYPIRLYNAAEVVAEPASEKHYVRLASPARQVPPVAAAREQASLPLPRLAEIPAVVAIVPATMAPGAAVVEPDSLSGTMLPAATPRQPMMVSGATASPAAVAEVGARFGTATAGGAKMESVASTGPPLVLAQPLYRENPQPEYPPLARRRNLQGTVVLEVLVDAHGHVAHLTVHQSSGQRLLDEAALRSVEGWRFEPGRRGGEPLAMKVKVPVRFELR